MSDQEQRDREQQPVEVETEGHAWRGKYASETDETPGESKGDVEGHGLKEGDDPDAGKPPSDQSKDARLSDRKGKVKITPVRW